MTQDEAKQSSAAGRLVIAALATTCVVLGALNLWQWFGSGRPSPAASEAPAQPSGAEASRGRQPEATLSSRPDGTAPSISGAVQDRRVAAPGPLPGNGVPAQVAQGPAPDLGRSAPPTVPAQGSSPARLDPPESPAAVHATSASGPHTPGAAVPPPAAPPPAAPPPVAGEASPDADKEPEPAAPVAADTASDRTPPTLDLLRFDPPVVEGGATTTLTIQATDTLSGVKSVRGEIQSPSGGAVLPIWLQDARGGNAFTYVMTIPRAAETGVWFVKWLYLTDVADNSNLIQVASAKTAPPGGTFSVYSSESDSIPPDVRQISFDKEIIEEEDRNLIRVEVSDDLSGVTSVTGACQSPSRSALIWFTCTQNAESGAWEGDVVIPGNADCGGWSVQQLTAKDKAGNTTLLTADSPVLAHAGFTIAPRADCDSSPPTLDGFALSQRIVSSEVATEILVTASVHDVGSGAATMTGWFEGPVSEGGQVPKNHFTCAPDPEHPEAPWNGKLLVPQFAPKGTWKVRVIRLEDKALNVREYTPDDPVVSGGVFEVQ